MHLGWTYMLDARVMSVRTEDECRLILPLVVTSIGMTPLGDAVILPHLWGPSGWQMMMESHLAFDYFYQDFICVDLFSCNEFDPVEARKLLVEHFDVDYERAAERMFPRGIRE